MVKNNFRDDLKDNRKTLHFTITPSFNIPLNFNAEAINTDGNSLFVLSVPKCEIHIINLSGKRIDSIINKSDSSSRNEQIMDFYGSNNILDIADTKSRIISSFDFNNNLKKTANIPYKVNRICFADHNKVIVETVGSWKNKAHFSNFTLIDFRTRTDHVIPQFIPTIDYNGLIFDGFFARNPSGGGFFINYFYNNITCFDTSGNIMYVKKTIDDAKLPKIKVSEMGWSTYVGDIKPINFSASIDSSFIYILSNVQRKLSSGLVSNYVDLYRLKDGKYYGSILLPSIDSNIPSKICIAKKELFALYKNNLVCYNIKNL